jgi:protein-S-isoprenylcysteine O-methyltransferase Ste14
MKKFSPVILYRIFIGLMLIFLFLPIKKQIAFPINLLGLIPFSIGTFMAVSSKRVFKHTNTPMHPFTNPTQLHTQGFFKYSRNPMYLGITIGLLGLAILSGHFLNLLFPLLYISICDLVYVRAEEKKLMKKFGSKYYEYKQRTRRWI